MRPDHGAGALAVEVEVSHEEALARLANVFWIRRVDRPGQAVLRVVGQLEGVLEVLRFGNRENGAKDLFLKDSRLRVDIGDHRGLDEVAVAIRGGSPGDQAALFLTRLDVTQD